eukprot:CAMPEP_0180527668 /NCGR_PEP_ID=MMETSP1036_2-20121128/60358_1 /TAXON_ID=632150 /ORGANISM="Azadinium spinosum, Strain 3D9" /LENGTH=63 /DNA_ID=CAMNT_0022541117 /DNA_START=20 /DNA_END=212 /DNA_ORIENTATION=-
MTPQAPLLPDATGAAEANQEMPSSDSKLSGSRSLKPTTATNGSPGAFGNAASQLFSFSSPAPP